MDIEKVINALEYFLKNRICLPHLIPWAEISDAIVLLKEQEQMYYTLEHDWRMCRELLKEQQERIETLESLRKIEQEGR